MKLFEAHHGFWGLLLMLGGFVLIFTDTSLWIDFTLIGLGLLSFMDDSIQHAIQKNNPNYLSPLHRWFYKLYYWIKG